MDWSDEVKAAVEKEVAFWKNMLGAMEEIGEAKCLRIIKRK